jgi:hypothetical protein
MEQFESFALIEIVIRWLGGLLAYSTLVVLLYGIWRGTQRKAGRVTGLNGSWLSSQWFYLASALLLFGICYFGWSPLPWSAPTKYRVWMLVLGSLFYFPGMLFCPVGTINTWKKLLHLNWFRCPTF